MVLATFFSFWRTLIWIWLFDFFNFLRRLVKKTDILPDRKRCPPPLYGQLFVIFLLFFWPNYYDYICSERDFTQEWIKSISMQLLESQIPPLTAAALPMIICKRLAPHFDNHKKGIEKSNFNEKKTKIFTFAYGQGWAMKKQTAFLCL